MIPSYDVIILKAFINKKINNYPSIIHVFVLFHLSNIFYSTGRPNV